MTLEEYFERTPRAALAFSGGTDSAFLLWAARRYGCDVRPYFIDTALQPASALEDARRLAEEVGALLEVLPINILTVPEVAANGPERCYHCKKAMFSLLRQRALADGYEVLLDGTNASDDAGDRPGMRALEQLQVCSPLRLCGVTKREIRQLSRQAGLSTWDKPACACLATRIPVNTPIAPEPLERVERGEMLLARLGFRDFRLRLTGGGGCRLEITREQFPLALARREEILTALAPLFSGVVLDLAPRRGSE